MNITIGEITNVILPFTTSINVFMRGSFPCIQSSIGNINSVTKLFLSVMQTSEHVYSIGITDDVYNGNRLIPVENSETPFIREKYFFDQEAKEVKCIKNIPYTKFKTNFHMLLYQYQLIRFNPSELTTKVTDLGFNSLKIRRIIDKSFKKLRHPDGSISDLIHIVNDKKVKFDLDVLEEKEIKCVYAKLKSIGLETIIIDNKIIRVEYERRS